MNAIYTAVAHSTGDGRNSRAYSDDGALRLDLRTPKELGGPGGGTNPEELFAAGYAACFHSALKLVARKARVDLDGSQVSASVGLGMLPSGGFGLAATIDVHVPDVDRDVVERLVDTAHTVCPYSNATRGNMDVTLSVA